MNQLGQREHFITLDHSDWFRRRHLIQPGPMRLSPGLVPVGIINVVLCNAEVDGDQESLPENEANREEKETRAKRVNDQWLHLSSWIELS